MSTSSLIFVCSIVIVVILFIWMRKVQKRKGAIETCRCLIVNIQDESFTDHLRAFEQIMRLVNSYSIQLSEFKDLNVLTFKELAYKAYAEFMNKVVIPHKKIEVPKHENRLLQMRQYSGEFYLFEVVHVARAYETTKKILEDLNTKAEEFRKKWLN